MTGFIYIGIIVHTYSVSEHFMKNLEKKYTLIDNTG